MTELGVRRIDTKVGMTPREARKEYLLQRILTASPVELVRILHEAAAEAIADAQLALRSGDILQRGQAITKAVEIIAELRLSLRRDVSPQYCDMLAGLYGYLQRQLIRAHAEQSESILQEVSQLLQTLLEGWVAATEPQSAKVDPALADQPGQEGVNEQNPYSSAQTTAAPGRSWQL